MSAGQTARWENAEAIVFKCQTKYQVTNIAFQLENKVTQTFLLWENNVV